jgi:GPH family glycoside/pentoside/hexuronide:cation symporter
MPSQPVRSAISRSEGSTLGPTAVFGYALGSLGTGVFSTIPTVLLLYYCTEILHLPVLWATAIVFVPKIWAIFWDPLVGAWSDRTTGPFGRRRPFLAAGTAGVSLTFLALFSPPSFLDVHGLAAWAGVAYFALATVYSLFAVPYIAVAAEIADDREVRTRLVRWRMTMAMVGVLAGAGLAPWIVSIAGGGRVGYAAMALTLAIACALAMSSPVVMLRAFDPPREATVGSSPLAFLHNLPLAFSNRRFVRLALSYLLMLTAVGAVSAATPYLVHNVLARSDVDLGSALSLMIIITTLTIPLISGMGSRFGDVRALRLGAVAYGALTVGLGLICRFHAPWPLVLVMFAGLGAPFAAAQVLPFTLLVHTIHGEKSGQASMAGVFTGVWTATEKMGLALGPALAGIARALGSPQEIMPLFVTVVPAILMVGALVPLLTIPAPSQHNPSVSSCAP